MVSSGMLRHVALVRTDVSGELSASIIRVTRIGELRTTLAVTSIKLLLLLLLPLLLLLFLMQLGHRFALERIISSVQITSTLTVRIRQSVVQSRQNQRVPMNVSADSTNTTTKRKRDAYIFKSLNYNSEGQEYRKQSGFNSLQFIP
jgi:hypothetical protein